jgi:hypothetical protein
MNQTQSLACSQQRAKRLCFCAHQVLLGRANWAIPINKPVSNSHSSQQHPLTTFLLFHVPIVSQSPAPFTFLPFSASPRILQVICSIASLQRDWQRPVHPLNPASESPPANAEVRSVGNASPAMNETLIGTTTKERCVASKALASMRVNSDSVSNEIDESDLQPEKHDEQRI